jgi:hypothetical protein
MASSSSHQRRTMAQSHRHPTHQDSEATLRSIIRRLDALEQRLQRSRVATQGPSAFERRWEILEAPNRKATFLNQRLRAEGLEPVALGLSLTQRVKKLRQLEARNSARSAMRTASS